VCVSGKALVGLYDSRKEETLANYNPILLQIPPLISHGFTAIDCEKAAILNIPDKLYKHKHTDEYRLSWNSKDIPFKWSDSIKIGG